MNKYWDNEQRAKPSKSISDKQQQQLTKQQARYRVENKWQTVGPYRYNLIQKQTTTTTEKQHKTSRLSKQTKIAVEKNYTHNVRGKRHSAINSWTTDKG